MEAASREEPNHDEAGEHFDQAVDPEGDQGNRPGRDASDERDRELDEMPRNPGPGKEPRPSLKRVALRGDRHCQAHAQLELVKLLGHLKSVTAARPAP